MGPIPPSEDPEEYREMMSLKLQQAISEQPQQKPIGGGGIGRGWYRPVRECQPGVGGGGGGGIGRGKPSKI